MSRENKYPTVFPAKDHSAVKIFLKALNCKKTTNGYYIRYVIDYVDGKYIKYKSRVYVTKAIADEEKIVEIQEEFINESKTTET